MNQLTLAINRNLDLSDSENQQYKDAQAIYRMAEYMIKRRNYWIALYQCLTLQYWCQRNSDIAGVKFWSAVYALIKRDWSIRI